MILETAILGSADYLVTRDDDIKSDRELIALLKERNVSVVTVRQFLDLVN
jgi:predicted nucleic acid-binding protein